jgi:hypothetical protein
MKRNLHYFYMSVAKMGNAGSSTTPLIEAVHKTPHLSDELKLQNPAFNIKSLSYLKSLIIFPCTIFAAGILALLVFGTVLLTRCCLECSKCQPKEAEIIMKYHGSRSRWRRNINIKRTILLTIFSFFLITAFVADHILLLGNSIYDSGLKKMQTSVTNIYEAFDVVANEGMIFLIFDSYSN